MNYLILIFGVLISIAGIVLVLRPAILFNFLHQYQDSSVIYGLAILARAVFGIALLLIAPTSQFPLALSIIGWIAIVAAIFIGAIGPARFHILMAWVLNLSTGWGRVAGLFTLLFGGFLVYAVQFAAGA